MDIAFGDGMPITSLKHMMTATLGRIPELQPGRGNFYVYLERFEEFASANDIAADEKLQLFLTAIGDKAYVSDPQPIAAKYDHTGTVPRSRYCTEETLRTQMLAGHQTVTVQSTETRAARDRDRLRGRTQKSGNDV